MADIPAPLAFDCTPSSLIASSPCIACVSESEMLATMVGIAALSADRSIADIMKDSACFSCLSKKQMLQALVTILGSDLLGERYTQAQILDEMRCIRRCSNEKQLLSALLYLLCNDIGFTSRLVQ